MSLDLDPRLPHRLVTERFIPAAPSAIWSVLADFGNVYQWSSTVTHSHRTSARGGRVRQIL
jgi:hypothetical protein